MSRSARRRRAGPALLLLVGLASCSVTTGSETSEAQSTEGVPDTIAVRVLHRVYKDGHLSMQLEASRAEGFDSRNQTILSNARFTTYDDQQVVSTEGEARTVVFHSDTENAEISGGVRVHSATEKGDVTANSLYWENKTRRLTAPPTEAVTLRKDDGTVLNGTGFAGDFNRRELTFSGPVQGSYVSTEK